MRKNSVLALVLALCLLASACGGTPPAASAANNSDGLAPAVLPSAPVRGETVSPPPSAGDAPAAPEQDQADDTLPPEAPAETSEEQPEASAQPSDDGKSEQSEPPQSSLPDEKVSTESPSQPDVPSEGDPDPIDSTDAVDALETSPAQEQGDPPGSRWLTINEAAALTLINKERGRLGVQPLTFDPDLTAAARVRAAEMLWGNYLSRSRPDGSSWETVLERDVPVAFTLAAENRAWTDHPIGQDIAPFQWFQMWQQNETQYAAMTDPRYTHCGVAVLAGPYFDGEQSYAVAVFGGY